MQKFTKLFNTKPSSIDDTNKTVTFTISDNQPDRMGEVVDQASWDFKNYLNNPIVLWGHDPDEAENVLGTALSLNISPDGSHTEATLSFATAINEKANMVFEMIKAGILRTVSVGFINHTLDSQDDTPVLKDNELLEISVVPIPANPRAISLSYTEGRISRKDANWLITSMKKETELLEKQVAEDQPTHKEKSMDPEQFDTLMQAVQKLSEAQVASDEKIATLTEQLAEATKPPVVEELKEEPKEEIVEEDASAKDGEIDQSGAEDKNQDEFDPDAELTDEVKAEIDAALAAQLVEAA